MHVLAVLKKSFVRYGYLKDESERSFVHQVMIAVVSTEWSDSAGKFTDLVRLELDFFKRNISMTTFTTYTEVVALTSDLARVLLGDASSCLYLAVTDFPFLFLPLLVVLIFKKAQHANLRIC